MKLRDLLKEPLIQVDLKARTKNEAIDELIDLLVAKGEIARERRPKVAAAVFARERAKSTGMEHGVALPHAVVEGIGDVAAALGISREGIPFDSLDGKPTRLVVLLVIPQNLFQVHVKTLAGIARLLNDERFREELRAAKTPAEAYRIIREGEGDGG